MFLCECRSVYTKKTCSIWCLQDGQLTARKGGADAALRVGSFEQFVGFVLPEREDDTYQGRGVHAPSLSSSTLHCEVSIFEEACSWDKLSGFEDQTTAVTPPLPPPPLPPPQAHLR